MPFLRLLTREDSSYWQCDRNLPVCNHCTEDEGAECNYTPKKRHKVPSDHAAAAKERQPTQPYTAKTASFLISDMPNEENYTTGNWIAEHPEALRGRLPPGMYEIYSSGSQGSDDESMDGSNSPRHRPSHDRSWEARMLSAGPSGSRPCAFEGTLLPSRYLDPWYHSAFAPLPRSILQGIRTVNPVEMPSRQNYDEALFKFLHDLPPELGEISAFSPEAYSDLARAVAEGDTARLSSRLKSWTQFHHVRSGSRKYHLLLLPREAYFSIRPEKEDRLRNEFIAEVDGETPTNKSSVTSTGHGPGQHVINSHEGVSAFLRIPVLPQIYDVLVYAHKNHASSAQTLAQVRQAGVACVTWPMVETFVRLCPLCNLRAKSTPQQ
ncbi:hypothetical protein EW146_g4079 [Bondarzewia mesenterica]|uniref:Uncharacterized protein n=1 Tax=Bondarzewia mesenterica TaxID=1095465 RepID=A0A4S4LWP6_9AGAM|nr:hypothetical protein EW146_g4079 [Bondarzewia mesenterica]